MLWMLLGAMLAIGLLYAYTVWQKTQRGKKTLPGSILGRLLRLRRANKQRKDE